MHSRAFRSVSFIGVPLLAALSLLSALGCSAETRIDLHGQAPKVGWVFRDEVREIMTNAAITITGAGMTETGHMDLLDELVCEEEILAVADGNITKSRLEIISEKFTDTVRSLGQTETHTEPSPLDRETIEFEKVGVEWKRTLVGKVPSPKQAEDLKHFPPPESMADWFPAEPVRLGQSWTVDLIKLRRFFGAHAQIDSGQCKLMFEKKITKEGKSYAQIAKEIEIHGKFKGAKCEWHKDLKLTGASLLPLHPRGIGTMRLAGSKTMSTMVIEGGQILQVRISGPATLELKSSRKEE